MAEEKQLWRCRLCGNEQPVGENNNICTVKACGADLTLYGDIVEPPTPVPHRFNWKPLVIVLAVLVAAAGIGFGGWSLGRGFGDPTGAEQPISTSPPDADTPEANQPESSPEETAPPEAPQEPDKTELPDFGAFSNGWAHELTGKAQTSGETYSKYYEYTGKAGDVMIPEYIDLLTEASGFALTDTTTSSTESAELTEYSFGVPGGAFELTLQDARSVQGGGGELKLSFTSGLTPVAGEEKTSYKYQDTYTLQDFAAFAGGLAGTPEESEDEYGHKFNYPLSSDEAAEAANQYITLIKSCAYPYYLKQAGTYAVDGLTGDFIGLEEFGPNKDLAHFFMMDTANNTYYTESIVVYVSMDTWQDGSKGLSIVVSPGIALADDGYRASV